MNSLLDRRGNCMSIMLTIRYPIYSEVIECAYNNSGGIRGQRGTLRSSTAIRIRKRMIDDIVDGTVLPPVVIGVAEENIDYAQFQAMDDEQVIRWLKEHSENLSLIDGVQRTTALKEATEKGDLSDYFIRVELWIAKNVNNLIYRMLILNSGQVPWDIRRQLEAVFGAALKQIQSNTPDVTIFYKNDERRRRVAGQYQSDDILELYLAFGSRKEKIDMKERLSDEFVRLDFLDVTSADDSTMQFAEALSMMGMLDRCFARDTHTEENEGKERFRNGIDIFHSQPARVGFIVSTAILMLGRPGNTQSKEELTAKWMLHKRSFLALLDRMDAMGESELSDFLALPMLSERLMTKRASKVGSYEREFFKEAFSTLYDECENLSSFKVCWNAY